LFRVLHVVFDMNTAGETCTEMKYVCCNLTSYTSAKICTDEVVMVVRHRNWFWI